MVSILANVGVILLVVGFLGLAGFFFFDFEPGPVLGSLFLGAVLILPAIIEADNKRRDEFMTSCLADKKDYECTAMWRAGENRTVVAPMPVVVTGGR